MTERELRHNKLNEVTGGIHLVTSPDGTKQVRKRLRRPVADSTAGMWRASDDPRAYGWWRREADVYEDTELRASAEKAGLGLPDARVEDEGQTGLALWLEWVDGRTAETLTLEDYVAFATALGRWQGGAQVSRPWTSTGFLRSYAGANLDRARDNGSLALMDDDAIWRHPLIAGNWPDDLRPRWQALLDDAPRLHDLMESLPRTLCHLDAWALNLVRRPDGAPVLIDWAFAGDGAVGEDIGNAIPDASFDLCWPADRAHELDAAMTTAYAGGLRTAGWDGDERLVRLGIVASCVKYTWLLPMMLLRTQDEEQKAYQVSVDADELYRARGTVFGLLADWHDEARSLALSVGLA